MDLQKENIKKEFWDWAKTENPRLVENAELGDVYAIQNLDHMFMGFAAAKAQAALEVKPSRHITLTCAQLREAFMFGAPDKDDQEQLETEMTITWSENGHSGKGYYCYYSDLPEEGAIFLDDVIEAQEQAND